MQPLTHLKASAAALAFCFLAACAPAELVEHAPMAASEIAPPVWMMPDGQAHFSQRVAEIEAIPTQSGGVLLLGDSITEAWKWQAETPFDRPIHMGVGWDVTEGLLARLPQMQRFSPDRALIMIGTNDISYQREPAQIVPPVEQLILALRRADPDLRITLQSVLPREPENAARVVALNRAYEPLAAKLDVEWLDLTPAFSDADGALLPALTDDRLHLNDAGYQLWARQLRIHDTQIDG